jgi:hypothetical protein
MEIRKNYFKNLLVNGLSLLLCFVLFLIQGSALGQMNDPGYAFRQNERLGRGGNLGNILYKWDNWDKENEIEEMEFMKKAGLTGIRINTRPFLHMNKDPEYTFSWNEANGYSEDSLFAKKPPYFISNAFLKDWIGP